MLAKWKIELVSFLSALSMFSVGFSSWNISSTLTNPAIQTADGTVQTDCVIKTDEYVFFSKDADKTTDDGIILPLFNAGGFVRQNENGVYYNSAEGYITLYFTVDGTKCNATNSPLKNNGDNRLNIICEFTTATNQTELFNDNLSDVSPSAGGTTITNKEFITNTNGKVGYRFIISNYDFTALENAENPYGLITVSIKLTSKSKMDLKDLLNENTFIFNTEVNGVYVEESVQG